MKKVLAFFFILCLVALLVPTVWAAESGTCGENVTWVLDDSGTLTISGSGAMTDYASTSASPWYSQRTSVKAIVIEDGVTTIGDRTFYNCTALKDVTIGSGVQAIGTYAFRGCAALMEVTIPANVTELKDSTFRACTALTVVAFEGNAPTIGNYVFNDGAASLTMEYFEGSTGYDVSPWTGYTLFAQHVGQWIVDSEPTCMTDGSRHIDCAYCQKIIVEKLVGKHSFNEGVCCVCNEIEILCSGRCGDDGSSVNYTLYGTGLLKITGLGSVFDSPWLNYRDRVKTVVVESGIRFMGDFSGCRNLESIVIPNSVTSIGGFWGCDSLERITIPESVTRIEGGAFGGCTSLREISIPESVTSIEDRAFYGCSSLTHISIPENITKIEDGVFYGCSNLVNVALPEGVISIGESAFYKCSSLMDMKIPTSVKSIGMTAFGFCSSMVEIYIPNSVESTNIASFGGCSSLQQIRLPNSLTSIDEGLLSGCDNLARVNIPASATSIGDYAFENCGNLSCLIIPESVTKISSYAFDGCESLTSIHYTGTLEQKKAITIMDGNECVKDLVWHCGVSVIDIEGQTMYYCPECDLHYLPDGSAMSQEPGTTLTGSGFSLSFEDEILVNFYYTVSDLTDVTEQGMLVFYADPGTADIAKADDVYDDAKYVESSGSYIVTTHGISAKQMGDDHYYCAYAKLSDGSYAYSKLYQYSPKKYAMNMLGKASTSEKQKALCVAMLNYGAAAQNFFGYRTDDLMNASLTDEQKALVVAYDEAMFTGAIAADSGKIVNFAKTATGFSSRSASVSFEGAFSINYYFTPSVAVNGEVTLYYWTPEDYVAATVLTVDNVSGSSAMVAADGNYWGQVSGIAAKKLDDTYYVAGVYTDADGNTYCTGVIAYSLSKYCLNNAKPGKSMQELASATAMYGYYANAYFS